jgi:hypothetical protein
LDCFEDVEFSIVFKNDPAMGEFGPGSSFDGRSLFAPGVLKDDVSRLESFGNWSVFVEGETSSEGASGQKEKEDK